MSTLTYAEELLALIRQTLATALTAAHPIVTLDPIEAQAATASGIPAVLIDPPQVQFVTYHETQAEWAVNLIAGHTEDHRLAAWEDLDSLADALRIPLDLDTLTPTRFIDAQGATYPAFLATTSLTYTQEDPA